MNTTMKWYLVRRKQVLTQMRHDLRKEREWLEAEARLAEDARWQQATAEAKRPKRKGLIGALLTGVGFIADFFRVAIIAMSNKHPAIKARLIKEKVWIGGVEISMPLKLMEQIRRYTPQKIESKFIGSSGA